MKNELGFEESYHYTITEVEYERNLLEEMEEGLYRGWSGELRMSFICDGQESVIVRNVSLCSTHTDMYVCMYGDIHTCMYVQYIHATTNMYIYAIKQNMESTFFFNEELFWKLKRAETPS